MNGLQVRPVIAADLDVWLPLWQQYCNDLGEVVSDEVTMGVWQRILANDQPIWSLLACGPAGNAVGMANYVLHPHTWSLKTVCYLEDLIVAPDARGTGAGRALIEALVVLGRRHGWRRVYWHTREENYRARTLYDRVARRTDHLRYDVDL